MAENRTERKKREKEEAINQKVETTWKSIKADTISLYGKKHKIRKIVRSKANELPVMTLKEGGRIDHYENLKKAICIDGAAGFNNYIELVNKRINELKK